MCNNWDDCDFTSFYECELLYCIVLETEFWNLSLISIPEMNHRQLWYMRVLVYWIYWFARILTKFCEIIYYSVFLLSLLFWTLAFVIPFWIVLDFRSHLLSASLKYKVGLLIWNFPSLLIKKFKAIHVFVTIICCIKQVCTFYIFSFIVFPFSFVIFFFDTMIF